MRVKKSPILQTLVFLHLLVNAAKPSSPNVIIILADDIGFGDLSWLGASTIQTLNVDKLAHECT